MAEDCRTVQGGQVMARDCEKPNKTISTHILGVSAFVGAGRLILRFDDEQLNKIVSENKINFCPMFGRKLTEYGRNDL